MGNISKRKGYEGSAKVWEEGILRDEDYFSSVLNINRFTKNIS